RLARDSGGWLVEIRAARGRRIRLCLHAAPKHEGDAQGPLASIARHQILIDRSVPLAGEPAKGHNRWPPDTKARVICEPGDEALIETRDAFDRQFRPRATPHDVAKVDLNRVHPLTGPVYVEGAEPGDLLVVDILEVSPSAYGYTAQVPGFGFLR